jgi:hypothetical protein
MDQTNDLFDLRIDQQNISLLSETARWGKFLSIVGFVMCALFVVVALFAGSIIAGSMAGVEGMGAIGGGAFTFIYLVGALLWFMPCLYLYNFSAKMQIAIRSNDQNQMTVAFRNLKSCLKFMGILTIIMLCLYALGIIIGIGASMATM